VKKAFTAIAAIGIIVVCMAMFGTRETDAR